MCEQVSRCRYQRVINVSFSGDTDASNATERSKMQKKKKKKPIAASTRARAAQVRARAPEAEPQGALLFAALGLIGLAARRRWLALRVDDRIASTHIVVVPGAGRVRVRVRRRRAWTLCR